MRIGTAEIYRQVEPMDEVEEGLCVGQDWRGDVRVVLFVRLAAGRTLDKALIERIRARIRAGASPRHVPARVVAVPDIPRTRSGKIVELAVRAVGPRRGGAQRRGACQPRGAGAFPRPRRTAKLNPRGEDDEQGLPRRSPARSTARAADLFKAAPGQMRAFRGLMDAATADGALTSRTKELMALSIAIATRCEGCVVYHARAAHKLGASREEVAETIGVALEMGGRPGGGLRRRGPGRLRAVRRRLGRGGWAGRSATSRGCAR